MVNDPKFLYGVIIVIVCFAVWLFIYLTIRLLVPTPVEQGRWEVVPDTSNTPEKGFWRVRWSTPDHDGSYLWVGHYGYDDVAHGRWCEVAAENHCRRLNDQDKSPWEYPAWRG